MDSPPLGEWTRTDGPGICGRQAGGERWFLGVPCRWMRIAVGLVYSTQYSSRVAAVSLGGGTSAHDLSPDISAGFFLGWSPAMSVDVFGRTAFRTHPLRGLTGRRVGA